MTGQTAPRSRTSAVVPLKVSESTKAAIRYGAVLFAETQQEFMDRAVRAFFDQHVDEIEEKVKIIKDNLHNAR